MKKFNQSISIEISVDSIADLLLNNLHPDFKHKEIAAEAIVGRMMNDNSLGYLYNSLNGFPCNVDFQVGDELFSEIGIREYGFWTTESIERDDSIYGTINFVTVVDIDIYMDSKLKIQFQVPNKKGGMDNRVQWVKHTAWNKVLPVPVEKEPDFGMSA
jgi:hypothetical protein